MGVFSMRVHKKVRHYISIFIHTVIHVAVITTELSVIGKSP